ncbi:hypothetical protein GCM10007385_00050 [Tateyamaria omphalii]|nr:hypothetical protein GCM10007385_00050 [Tateyamaria omphalii]
MTQKFFTSFVGIYIHDADARPTPDLAGPVLPIGMESGEFYAETHSWGRGNIGRVRKFSSSAGRAI